MARRRRNTVGSRMADSAKQSGRQLLSDWAALTFRADNTKLGPVSLSTINWILLLACLAGLWFLPDLRKPLAIALGVGFLVTLGRAAAIMPKRRKTLQTIYDQNIRSAGLPRGSANNPANPKDRIQVRRWGKKAMPLELTMTLGDCPATTSVYAHPIVEKQLHAALGEAPADQRWLFDWPSSTQVHVRPVPTDSQEALRQTYNHKVRKATTKLLNIKQRDSADYFFECSDWTSETTRQGTQLEIPGRIIIGFGDFDDTNPTNRDKVERNLDKQLKTPGEWLYEWSEGELELRRVERQSTEAKRKRTIRKISDDVTGLVRGDTRNTEAVTIEVDKWMAPQHLEKLLGTNDVPDDYPQAVTIDLGTRNVADRRRRDRFESDFDTAMAVSYPQVTWLYNWEAAGGATILYTKAVATTSTRALRKNAERRLRNVVESKFGSSRNFVDCDVLEWQDHLTDDGEALPQTAMVKFGDYDVTKPETQDGFQQHWDSLTDACDWHYKWSPAEGIVTMNAVPPLPKTALFPQVGTDEFTWLCNQARDGKIIFGPQKGGGWLTLDLNSVPHALVGGATGSGKSVTLTVLLFLSMYNVDLFELYVCDPKRTDFTWTPEFPNVTKFAALDTEIVAAVAAAKQEMDRRQTLLSRVGVRNLRELRAKLKANPELEREHGPAPRRLILFFDELAEFLAKGADKDMEELKDEARADLEAIGRLGRAMEVNIISAAQKPDAKIISTQLREQLGFRLCVGPVNRHTSEQILNSDHGTRFPSQGNPKGRSWAWDSKEGYRMAQSFFIPDETGPLPWDPTAHIIGSKDMLRQHLSELGYARTQITNAAGGTEPRWVRVESEEMADSFDDSPPAEAEDPSGDTIVEDDGEDFTPAPLPEESMGEDGLPTDEGEAPHSDEPTLEEPVTEKPAASPQREPVREPARVGSRPVIPDDDEEEPF